MEAGRDIRDGEKFYDLRFTVARVGRGWVLAGPLYCAGRLDALPTPLAR